MKRQVISEYTLGDKRSIVHPFLYFTKHGIGPGTLPKDVELVRFQDTDDYVTAIWLDRPLSTEELDQYDIYPETMNNRFKEQYGIEADEEISDEEIADEYNGNNCIAVFSPGSKEYKRLEAVAMLLNFATNSDDYYVNNTYFDYGQDWKWTTILKNDKSWGGIQVIYPALQKEILNANNIDKIAQAAKDVLNK